jgi:hypothetical protein
MNVSEILYGPSLVPSTGTAVVEVDELVKCIEKDQDTRIQGYVTKAYGWVDPSSWLNHRFVVLTIEHRSETRASRTYYLRIDRRPEKLLSPFKFVTNSGKAKSSDLVRYRLWPAVTR